MFPKNAWYVAATPDEIEGRPLGRRICGEADRAIDRGTARGHIFNLGHGVPPNTDADAITRTVKMVHEL